MGVRSLKSKIAINISVFLLIGMVSIDIVTMMTAQRTLIQAEVAKGRAVAKALNGYLLLPGMRDDPLKSPEARAQLGSVLDEAGVACFFLIGRSQNQIVYGANHYEPREAIETLTRQVVSDSVESVHFIGSTFGFFWFQHEYLVVCTPLRVHGEIVGGFSLAFSLEGIYQSLRRSQQILFLYIFLNTVILSVLGIYRVFKLYLQPLARLAKRAEDYKEDDEVLFAARKGDNELLQVSTALNRLLGRLSGEKEKLKNTVSSLKQANAELQKAQAEIIRAEKLASVGRLSAGIAHEIGNPIGIVTGYLELLKQSDVPEDERIEYLNRAENEIERISTIIRQLLDISRPSPGGTQAISVHALIQETAAVLKVQPFMSHVRLRFNFGALNDTVRADPNQLRQVFLNLIINAADAISAKGPGTVGDLIISTENPTDQVPASVDLRDWIHIRFSDNGIGIAQEIQANIFDPFFTTKDPGKGTGLGLSVSFMIVENAGGRINVASEAEKGTDMIILLPLSAPETAMGNSLEGGGMMGESGK